MTLLTFVVTLPLGQKCSYRCRFSSVQDYPYRPRLTYPSHKRKTLTAKLDALLFDCDGVLADTERDAHRVAFNLAFKETGLADEWDEALYGKLLETGGGKERMTAYWNEVGWPSEYADPDDRVTLVKRLHARKTDLFMTLVSDGRVPLRPGVQRLVEEAFEAGVSVSVCSTSNERAVSEIVKLLGHEFAKDIRIFAGDVVKKKKPSPDIYLLAKDTMNLDPNNLCVIEDSFIGVAAARAASMPVCVTKSSYTKNENFSAAQLVLDSLDSPLTTLSDLTEMVKAARVNV